MHLPLTTTVLVFGAVVVAIVVVAGIGLFARKAGKSTPGLLAGIGPGHDRAALAGRSERRTEAKPAHREARLEAAKIRDLGVTEREHFLAGWRTVQSRFVDHPKNALAEAQDLVTSLLLARGYPVDDSDRRAAGASLSHPHLLEYYRSAHGVAAQLARDAASAQDLRDAMVQYRWLFEELVQVPTPGPI